MPVELCPAKGASSLARVRVFERAHVARAHAHHLRGEGEAVPRLVERQHIAAHEFGLVLARLHEVRLYGIALVAPSVLARENAAVIIDHAVFFLACGFHIARSAHDLPPWLMVVISLPTKGGFISVVSLYTMGGGMSIFPGCHSKFFRFSCRGAHIFAPWRAVAPWAPGMVYCKQKRLRRRKRHEDRDRQGFSIAL